MAKKGKPDGKFVNLSEDHELSGFLNRRGYSGNKEGREKLEDVVKSIKGDESAKNVTWKELDKKFQGKKNQFSKT
jgi:hypothetical protein